MTDKENDKEIQLPDVQSHYSPLRRVLLMQGYDLTKIDNSDLKNTNMKTRNRIEFAKYLKGGELSMQSMKETEAGGVVVGKDGVMSDGNRGGIFKGKRHSDSGGGIKVSVKGAGDVLVEDNEPIIVPEAVHSTEKVTFNGKETTPKAVLSEINQKAGGVPIKKHGGSVSYGGGGGIEVKPSSVIITRTAIQDNKLHEFNGEKLTNRQILSKINEMGGGVSFEEGGEIAGKIFTSGKKHKYDGKEMEDKEIVSSCGCGHRPVTDLTKPTITFIDFKKKYQHVNKNGENDYTLLVETEDGPKLLSSDKATPYEALGDIYKKFITGEFYEKGGSVSDLLLDVIEEDFMREVKSYQHNGDEEAEIFYAGLHIKPDGEITGLILVEGDGMPYYVQPYFVAYDQSGERYGSGGLDMEQEKKIKALPLLKKYDEKSFKLGGTLEDNVMEFADMLQQQVDRYYGENYPKLQPNDTAERYAPVVVKDKDKYFYVDIKGSGKYMIDKKDNNVYGIKGYGVINRKKNIGNVDDIIRKGFTYPGYDIKINKEAGQGVTIEDVNSVQKYKSSTHSDRYNFVKNRQEYSYVVGFKNGMTEYVDAPDKVEAKVLAVKEINDRINKASEEAVRNIDKRLQKVKDEDKAGPRELKLSDIPKSVKTFMPEFQQKAIVGSEEHFGIIEDLQKIIEKMPVTYQTDGIKADEKTVYLHYFYGGSDWYIVEKDMEPEQLQAYGYTILNGDHQEAEWGYISIEEIKETGKVELDFFFDPIKFGELKKTWGSENASEEDAAAPKYKVGDKITLKAAIVKKEPVLQTYNEATISSISGHYDEEMGFLYDTVISQDKSPRHFYDSEIEGKKEDIGMGYTETIYEPFAPTKEDLDDIDEKYDPVKGKQWKEIFERYYNDDDQIKKLYGIKSRGFNGLELNITFNDGSEGTLDFASDLHVQNYNPPAFEPLKALRQLILNLADMSYEDGKKLVKGLSNTIKPMFEETPVELQQDNDFIFKQVDYNDGWIGNLIKERVVKQQLSKLVNSTDPAIIEPLLEKYKTWFLNKKEEPELPELDKKREIDLTPYRGKGWDRALSVTAYYPDDQGNRLMFTQYTPKNHVYNLDTKEERDKFINNYNKALAAGYKVVDYRGGKYGMTYVFEKNDRALTEYAFNNPIEGVDIPKVQENAATKKVYFGDKIIPYLEEVFQHGVAEIVNDLSSVMIYYKGENFIVQDNNALKDGEDSYSIGSVDGDNIVEQKYLNANTINPGDKFDGTMEDLAHKIVEFIVAFGKNKDAAELKSKGSQNATIDKSKVQSDFFTYKGFDVKRNMQSYTQGLWDVYNDGKKIASYDLHFSHGGNTSNSDGRENMFMKTDYEIMGIIDDLIDSEAHDNPLKASFNNSPAKTQSPAIRLVEAAIKAGKLSRFYKSLYEDNEPEDFIKYVADQAIGRTADGKTLPGQSARTKLVQDIGEEIVNAAIAEYPSIAVPEIEEMPQSVAAEIKEVVMPQMTASTSLMQSFGNKPQHLINAEIRRIVSEKGADRSLYSSDEIAFIQLYEGSGGMGKHEEVGARLLDQFFTPVNIISKMWGLAFKYGFNFSGEKAVLEPASGSGRFLKYIPVSANISVRAFDVDETSVNICKVVYPDFDIRLASFETMFFQGKRHVGLAGVDQFYDLVIGNPPYRDYVSEYAPLGERDATGAMTFEMYFIMRGVDVLKKDGLLIYIIPNTFLNNSNKYNNFKEKLSEKAELIDAYRLPNGVFGNTEVGTDIIVLKKK